MNQEFVIQSDQGDEYRLRITSDHIGMLSEDVLRELANKGVQVVDIELELREIMLPVLGYSLR